MVTVNKWLVEYRGHEPLEKCFSVANVCFPKMDGHIVY